MKHRHAVILALILTVALVFTGMALAQSQAHAENLIDGEVQAASTIVEAPPSQNEPNTQADNESQPVGQSPDNAAEAQDEAAEKPQSPESQTAQPVTDASKQSNVPGNNAAPNDAIIYVSLQTLLLVACAVAIAVLLPVIIVIRRDRKRAAQFPVNSSQSSSQPKTVPVPETLKVPLVGNVRHLGSRESQQDSFGVSSLVDAQSIASKGVLAVVADGMGGLENGNEISSMVVANMLKLFQAAPPTNDGSQTLLHLIHNINKLVNRRFGGDKKTGTTLVATIIHNSELSFISIGDSRIDLIRGGGMIQLNRRHTYGRELDEQACRETISFEEASENSRRVAVTSFLGMGELEKIDRNIEPIKLLPGDKIILMTDGVFNTLDDDTIVNLLSTGAVNGADLLGETMLTRARPHQDNFTAVILEV